MKLAEEITPVEEPVTDAPETEVQDSPEPESPPSMSELYDQLSADDEPENLQVEAEPEPEPAFEPPEHWEDSHKELFRSASPEYQQFLLDRHKAMEGDYTRKTQELAEQRKQYERQVEFASTAQQVIAPLIQYYSQRAQTDPSAAVFASNPLQVLAQAATYMRQYYENPGDTIRALAKNAGIELPQQDGEDEFVDPEVQRLREELAQVKQATQATSQQQQAFTQQQQQAWLAGQTQQAQSAIQEVESNAEAFPHFQNPRVRQLVGLALQSAAQQQQALTIPEAYQQVVDELGLQPPKTPEQIAAEKKAAESEKVRRARTAASGASSSGMPSLDGLSGYDKMAAIYDQLANGG